jgi:hypothetical protein
VAVELGVQRKKAAGALVATESTFRRPGCKVDAISARRMLQTAPLALPFHLAADLLCPFILPPAAPKTTSHSKDGFPIPWPDEIGGAGGVPFCGGRGQGSVHSMCSAPVMVLEETGIEDDGVTHRASVCAIGRTEFACYKGCGVAPANSCRLCCNSSLTLHRAAVADVTRFGQRWTGDLPWVTTMPRATSSSASRGLGWCYHC